MIKRICFLLSLLMCGVLYAQDITYRTVKDLSYSSSKDPYATERWMFIIRKIRPDVLW